MKEMVKKKRKIGFMMRWMIVKSIENGGRMISQRKGDGEEPFIGLVCEMNEDGYSRRVLYVKNT